MGQVVMASLGDVVESGVSGGSMGKIRNIADIIWFYRYIWSMRSLKNEIQNWKNKGDFAAERREIRKAEDAWGEAVLRRAGISLRVSGRDNIPDGPVVFVSNHQSYLDIPVFMSAVGDKPIGFVAKNNLSKIPGFGYWIGAVRSVFIIREDARSSLRSIEEGVNLLGEGFSLVIFPEGTRSHGPAMAEFKRGSLRLATKAGVPVVPVTLSNTFAAFEAQGHIKPAEVTFTFHPAIETKDMTKKEASDLARIVEEIVREGLLDSKK
jgi:1-acyl-sn-glycerol-3-phosphate acyltransferase